MCSRKEYCTHKGCRLKTKGYYIIAQGHSAESLTRASNPRCACAARVQKLGLSVCLSVFVSVTLHLMCTQQDEDEEEEVGKGEDFGEKLGGRTRATSRVFVRLTTYLKLKCCLVAVLLPMDTVLEYGRKRSRKRGKRQTDTPTLAAHARKAFNKPFTTRSAFRRLLFVDTSVGTDISVYKLRSYI